MHDELEPLPDVLARAFDAERSLVDEDPVMKRAVLAHVERAALLAAPIAATAGAVKVVGSGVASTAAASAKHVFTAKALALAAVGAFAAGTVTGGVVVTAARPSASMHVSPVVVPPPKASATIDVPSVPTLSASQLPSAVPTPEAVRPSPPASDLTRERELIDVGRAALAHENPQGALDAVERHRRAFPTGSLREERDALRVQALAAAGRTVDAEKAAKEFHRSYPTSLLAETVDAAVAPLR